MIAEIAGDRYAKNFVRWREVERLDVPLVILIGGTTGVGKSTIATQLAARLGIVRVVATDAIREVMRSMLSPELMPTLHTSSFHADLALREPGKSADPLLLGFREQTAAVSVGINALIERAATEGTGIIIEGAHIVPGFLDLDAHAGPVSWRCRSSSVSTTRAGISPTSRPARKRWPRGRPNGTRQDSRTSGGSRSYVKSQALSHGVPVLPNYSFDQSIAAVMDLVMERATAARRRDPRGAGTSRDDEADDGHREAGKIRMKLFLDTADIEEIREIQPLGRAVGRHDQPFAGREGGPGPRHRLEGDPRGRSRRHLARDHRDARPTRCTSRGSGSRRWRRTRS